MKRIKYLSLLVLTVALFVRCEEFDQQPRHVYYDNYDRNGNRTLIVYLAMNNNLDFFGKSNINAILSAASREAFSGGRVLIYRTFRDNNPVLMEVLPDRKSTRLNSSH